MPSWEKFTGEAADWTRIAYADPHAYLAHRADVVLTLGTPVGDGATVLDLACGDAAFAAYLPDQAYIGVDANEAMVAAAKRTGRTVVRRDLNDYRPDAPVDVTLIFRAIYYAEHRRELFSRIASYTTGKLVFDLNPRRFALRDVEADLRAAGFRELVVRPFFVPQTRALSAWERQTLVGLERMPPLASLVLRRRFSVICAALVD